MSCGSLPPVPDLIPISAFNKKQSLNNNRVRECAPCGTRSEVMGEQRSRRTGKQPAIDLIDTSRSRGLSAAPQAPFRKTRPERHRKSDRRREHRSGRKRSSSKQRSRSRVSSSPERPVNPRVNPIFVWVRQEDNHIVEVKCEDYDKRNRILLTKTAQGWRAIPRTETLVPSLREADDRGKHRAARKQRRTHKVKRKSTGVQVDEDVSETEAPERPASPTWTDPVNVESHLPSHTIHIPKKLSPQSQSDAEEDEDVNSSGATNSGVVECNINKTCDVTPLDNLLAVAELEFNHQLQSGEWNKCTETDNNNDIDNDTVIKEKTDEYIDNIEQLNSFIDSCTDNNINDTEHIIESFNDVQSKTDDCDYNEDDDNNLAMDDILNRLEQSLRSPETMNAEMTAVLNECDENLNPEALDVKDDVFIYEAKQDESNCVKNETDVNCYGAEASDAMVQSSSEDVVDSPTDLTNKRGYDAFVEEIQPTDLSLPKRKEDKSPPPRPPSQNSETIQSPQPSGIPAVPPSPDIFSNTSNNKTKSMFLETLLSNSCQKSSDTSEVMSHDKEPLDLGNFRKSASPTVTCSEEVKNKLYFEGEPSTKKLKVEDITLKKLLDVEPTKGGNINFDGKVFANDQGLKETSRLLELLTSPVEPDPVVQLTQVLTDSNLNIPDPMLVPKDRLSQILSSPAREIPRLLIDRPELRLPQALAYPHLLQDPDILVITLSQLQTIVHKQSQLLPLKDAKAAEEKRPEVTEEKRYPKAATETVRHTVSKQHDLKDERPVMKETTPRKSGGHMSELANDIDAATNAAFNQMMWLPYLNQLESNSFNNNSDFLKLLTMLPPYSTHVPDVSHLMGINRFMQPAAFSMQPPFNCNPLEFSTWQEAMLQANLLRPKSQYDVFGGGKNFYRDYGEKSTGKKANSFMSKTNNHKANMPNVYPPNMPAYQNAPGAMMNMPPAYHQASRTNLQIPQYNPVLSHKNVHKNRSSQHGKNSGHRADPYCMQRSEEKKTSHAAAQALKMDHNNYKMKALSSFTHQESASKASSDGAKHHPAMQPIDLSGSTASGSKLKVRQHLIDPGHTARLLKHDDIPEVGSTTASIEEMQDAQKYLWHPLFGNQKNYASPWNWTTVTATGE